jgi:hypothetical protein
MSDEFETRLRTAASAGWRTLAVAAALFLVQWLAYRVVVSARPAWVLELWGAGTDWEQVRTTWFWFLAGFKVALLAVALLLVWLTLWARELRKRSSGS